LDRICAAEVSPAITVATLGRQAGHDITTQLVVLRAGDGRHPANGRILRPRPGKGPSRRPPPSRGARDQAIP
jgi:hypothetical protein